jgi:pyruvate/2-oxoglutarate dehydrogenase complex dihydrolipoamide dehydrogenase (E3) component
MTVTQANGTRQANSGRREQDTTIVVGAGPGGLAVGAVLAQLGLPTTILERADRVGASWHSYYEGLRLNSPRRHSSLPGLQIDPGAGQWPLRHEMINYLERYARHHGLDISFGQEVLRISREGGQWRVWTSAGELHAANVVLATGKNARPVLPDWPGREGFQGELLHARDYRNAKPYQGKSVLVVGCGSSGADIALELIAIGARQVRISVRTPPLFLAPQRLGVPANDLAQLIKRSPAFLGPVFDQVSLAAHRRHGDLSKYGLPAPAEGVVTAWRTRGHGATIERGIVAAIKAGDVEVTGAVAGFEGAGVLLADGTRIQPDAVIAATGQRPSLEPLVGDLGVLGPDGRPVVHGAECARRAPNMYFIGYRLIPGQLPDMTRDACKIARRIEAGARK